MKRQTIMQSPLLTETMTHNLARHGERFMHCHGSIWQVDDFSLCFRKDYLLLFFPILLVVISASILALTTAYHHYKLHTSRRYRRLSQSVPNESNGADIRSHFEVNNTNDDDSSALSDSSNSDDAFEEHLSLRRTMSCVSANDVKIDRPKGEVVMVALEELAVMAEVALHVAAFVLHKDGGGREGKLPLLGGLANWSYILLLTTSRLVWSTNRTYPLPWLWSHTTLLYSLNFCLATVGFRSVFIHDYDTLTKAIVIAEFSLVTVLVLIGITSRKGNKPVRQEIVEGLEPSREPLASLLSLGTFSWVDAIVWKGYHQAFELKDVWNLDHNDLAVNVLSSFWQTKKTFHLAWTLAKYFKVLLLKQALWAVGYSLVTFAPTMLLRVILEYVRDPTSYPRNVAWLFVALLLVSGVVNTIANGQALWIGRRISVRLRAVIIGEVYSKALRRKAAAGSEHALGVEKDKKKKETKKAPSIDGTEEKEEEKGDEGQANTGAIINLMAVDSFKVAEVCAYLHYLLAGVPVQIVLAVILLYRILGWSSIAGMLAMVLLLPVNYLISRQFSVIQKRMMTTTDSRIHSTNEVLQNIRIIKYFAWEEKFEKTVDDSRKPELHQLRNRYILWAVSATLWYATPVLITFVSFWVYTVIEKKDLDAPIAFTALSLFNVLRVPLDQLADMVTNVLQTKVSVDRVEEFLKEDETEKYKQLKASGLDLDAPLIGFTDGNFTWGSKNPVAETDVSKSTSAFKLVNLNIEFKIGELNIIAGPTGSGKTSLLMALLGEMTQLEGAVYLPGSHSREDLYPDIHGHINSIAYCAQQAWLVNDTIKANILFSSDYNEGRYKAVLFACALERDLNILEAGDMTEVGEKGIALSGGQKQRISLARALYSNARHVLLDDCLSAVDTHTAKWIYEYCIMGELMEKRTCILVTHNVALCVPRSKFVVVMKGGEVNKQGTPEEIIASKVLGSEEAFKASASRAGSEAPSRVASTLNLTGTTASNGTANSDIKADEEALKEAEAKRLKDKEEIKSVGSVDWRVYLLYLKAMGGWFFWLGVFLTFSIQQLGSVATSWWIREWALQYNTEDARTFITATHYSGNLDHSFGGMCAASGTCAWTMPLLSSPVHNISSVTIQQKTKVDVMYYLTIYALLGLAYALSSLFREALVFGGSLKASRLIHDRLMHCVMRAKFAFFDQTPLGRIMNRFSKDIEAVDQEVAPVALGMVHSLAAVIVVIVLISAITPGFLIAGVFITATYTLIGAFYLRASRDLKRLESIQRSPLYQHFGETLAGITTIRAYGDERRFVRDNLSKIDDHNRPFLFLWATNRWLSIRVDVAGSFVSFFAGVFVLMSVGKIDAGLAGLSLTYAVTFTDNILWVVRLYAVNEQNMNSVERLREYLDVEQEGAALTPTLRPDEHWPMQGAVRFEDYSTRYRPDLDMVLKNVTFSINAGEKIGVVGRTGAGKSSLALALFRALEAENGKVVIDDVNIADIWLSDLRKAITMVPQDPTLFTGTIRNNVDPFGVYTDEEIFTALRKVQLIESADILQDSIEVEATSSGSETVLPDTVATDAQPKPAVNRNSFLDLSSKVAESGSNLSQGQRQLLCLARALLRQPRIILMDEATASIDYTTDTKIQATIRELDSTTITIAHRLNTIVDYDRVLVLDHGQVVEYDEPWVLLQKKDGVFRGMCESDGLEGLMEIAKRAWKRKHEQLVQLED